MKRQFYFLPTENCFVCYEHDSELLNNEEVYNFMENSVSFGMGLTKESASEDLDFNLAGSKTIKLQS
jgi:hypothetical protein